jgi:trimeric autotransporter adhesin
MATLFVRTSHDYRFDTLSNITEIDFFERDPAFATATFSPEQFDDVQISSSVQFTSDSPIADVHGIMVTAAGSGSGVGFSAANWTFNNNAGNDRYNVTIEGSDFADFIIGSSIGDIIDGHGAADILVGGSGNDLFNMSEVVAGESVDGGAGEDRIRVAPFQDYDFASTTLNNLEILDLSVETRVSLSAAQFFNAGFREVRVFNSELILHGSSSVNLSGLQGFATHLTINGTSGDDSLTGSPFWDFINGGSGADALAGGDGNDTLDGGLDTDTLAGGPGDDSYTLRDVHRTDPILLRFAYDQVTEAAGEGIDTVYVQRAGVVGRYTLRDNVENGTVTGADTFTLFGNALGNLLLGNSAANTLDGGSGNDTLNGGAGNDTLNGDAGNDTYFVDNPGDVVIENANDGVDTVNASIHYGLPPNFENLTLQGNADLQGYGNDLANTIIGNAGSNLINGGAGADTMVGGLGNETYFVDNAGDAVLENPGEGNDTIFSAVHFTLSANVENVILEGNADLQGYGNSQANVIYGNAGNNLLNGGGGIDLMVGGAGNDTYFVDDPSDSCFEVANEGSDAVFAFCHYGLAADVETLVMQGSGDFQGYGNNQANTLYGNAGNNLLNGAGGADRMLGGASNDTYFVDNAGDVVFENANEGTDAVFASVNYSLTANVEALVLQGAGNLSGTGNVLNNNVFGNSGDNTLNGEAGADALTGNAGNDTFVFSVGQADGDIVVDFAGNDAAAGDSLRFVGYGSGATFTNVDPTHWQVNYNNGASHEVITFMNGAPIHASDFVFA